MDSQRLRAASFVPHSVPLEIDHAEGAYLVTPDGRRILDAAGGAIVGNIGYGREEVAEVAAKALAKLAYIVPPWASEERVALVERLVRYWLPPGLTRVHFTSGGSESVEAALRLARQHHVAAGRESRWKVVGLDMAYHGVSLGALSVGYHATRRGPFEPMLPAFPHAPHPYAIPGIEPHPDPVGAFADLVEREGPETIAAFIAEPMVGAAGGCLVPPADYWPRIAEICRANHILVIADEVMTGFGRTGRKFGIDHWGVVPDIMVGGKGLAGGYAPMGAVYAREEVVAPLVARHEDLMFYTFAGHPASCATADKVLEIMEREALVERAERMGGQLRARLDAALGDHPNVGSIRGLGLLLGVEFVRDRGTMERFPVATHFVAKVSAEGLKRGVFFYPGGSGTTRDVAMFGPPFVINGEDIDLAVDTLKESVEAAVRSL